MEGKRRVIGRDYAYAWRNGPRWAFEHLCEGHITAFLRTLWITLWRGHIGETCQECGRPYLSWRAEHGVYESVTGLKRYPSGEWAPGLFCLNCFDRKARERGITIRWKPEIQNQVRDDG